LGISLGNSMNVEVFDCLKRESTILPNEEIIRHNICNVEL